MIDSQMQEKIDAVSSRYDGQRRQLIPCFDDFYGTVIDLLPNEKKAPKILDIGAGTGLLSALILEKYPDAEITLIDISQGMLDKAKEHLGSEKSKYIVADYSTYQFNENFDFVVSALSIHHLSNSSKELLYKTVGEILNSNGLFINADQFLGASNTNEKLNQAWWNKTVINSGLDEENISAWKERTAMDIPATVEDNLKWMKSAGLIDTDVFYKMYNFGVIYGKKN